MLIKGIVWFGIKDLYGFISYKYLDIVFLFNWEECYKFGYDEVNNLVLDFKSDEFF